MDWILSGLASLLVNFCVIAEVAKFSSVMQRSNFILWIFCVVIMVVTVTWGGLDITFLCLGFPCVVCGRWFKEVLAEVHAREYMLYNA